MREACFNRIFSFQLQLYICEKAMSGPEFEGDIFSCPEGQIVSVEFGEDITYQCVDETLGIKRSAEILRTND